MKSINMLMNEMKEMLRYKIIPFWLSRSVDAEFGGYLTCFDKNGAPTEDKNKYIVTQARMLWGFSYLSDYCLEKDRQALLDAAAQGFDFIIEKFWDKHFGGFIWKTDREGTALDTGKVVYGQSFGLYACAQYAATTGDKNALSYAEKVFELLQIFAADTLNGGYYENLEPDWSISKGGIYAGDRKSLDIHMHLMEAFDTLYAVSGKNIHSRKLKETVELLLKHMINTEKGYGYNQFTNDFRKIPAINIHRTWNAERESGQLLEKPLDTTSYGHNVELSWLIDQSIERLNMRTIEYDTVLKQLLNHSLSCGYDYEFGGVYRDGVADGQALVTDKEWWQNFESLVGYSNGYMRYNDEQFLDALIRTWDFIKGNFINAEYGESMQLLNREGAPIVAELGNPWKAIYHTGRALAETILRLERIIAGECKK